MNNNDLNKLKIFLSQQYPKGSWFVKADLDLVEIKAYLGTQDLKSVYNLIDILVKEGFLTSDYRFGKYLYEINYSETTEKENKDGKQTTDISRSQKSGSNEIVAHDFEKKKQQLQKFAKTLPKTSNLPSIRGGNHWYGPSVKATGDDLNNLSERIADSLSEQNENIFEIKKAFIIISDTFEALDKSYIQRILVNLKATEEANRKAVKGLEDNKKLLNSQKIIIEKLKKYKDELDKIKHLK